MAIFLSGNIYHDVSPYCLGKDRGAPYLM